MQAGALLNGAALENWVQHAKAALRWQLDAIRAGRAGAYIAPGRPVVAGLLSSASGVGRAARLTYAALREGGLDPQGIDLTPCFSTHRTDVEFQCSFEPSSPGPIIIQINPPGLATALAAIGSDILARRRRIGYWVWELSRAPFSWRAARLLVNEVWAPSNFAARAIAAVLKEPVACVPHPVAAIPGPDARAVQRMRSHLLRDGDFLIAASADARSSLARKNPQGAIAAFRAAFPDDRGARLVLHITCLDRAPKAAELRSLARSDSRITLSTDILSESEIAALVAAPDVWLSLNRGEGFGLILAERLLAGRMVIATAGSGSDDFLDTPGAVAIPSHPKRIEAEDQCYGGEPVGWLEPDLDAAVEALRRARTEGAPAPSSVIAAANARLSPTPMLMAIGGSAVASPPREPSTLLECAAEAEALNLRWLARMRSFARGDSKRSDGASRSARA